MRILFVAMANSIHTARWINHIADQGWDLHLFPSIDLGVDKEQFHSELRNITIHHSVYYKDPRKKIPPGVKRAGLGIGSPILAKRLHPLLLRLATSLHYRISKRGPQHEAQRLKRVIQQVRPDLIHSMEFQHGAYLTFNAREMFLREHPSPFPKWLVTNWGSDIYLFGRLKEHADKIRRILTVCDYYSCECERDIALAKEMGLKGRALEPAFPNAGGFDLEYVSQFRQPGPVSERRVIVLKGYQGWQGRALFALRAIELCAEQLKGYEVGIYSYSPEVAIAAELLTQKTGLPVTLIPIVAHQEILRWKGRARVFIGNNISDGISTGMLEALVMGAFPVQSGTACADEWLRHGETGFITEPEDIDSIVQAIRRAVTDDDLVNRAAEENWTLATRRLDHKLIRQRILQLYQTIQRGEPG